MSKNIKKFHTLFLALTYVHRLSMFTEDYYYNKRFISERQSQQ